MTLRIIGIVAAISMLAIFGGCSKGEKVELVEQGPAKEGQAQQPASPKTLPGSQVPGQMPGMQPSMERPVPVTPQGLPAQPAPRPGSGQAVGQPRAAVPEQARTAPPATSAPSAVPSTQSAGPETLVKPAPAPTPTPTRRQAPVQSLPGSAVQPTAKPIAETPKQTQASPVQPAKPAASATTPASAAPTVPVPPPPPKQETLKPTVSPMKELEGITPPTTNAPSPKVTTPAEAEEKKDLKEKQKEIKGQVKTSQ